MLPLVPDVSGNDRSELAPDPASLATWPPRIEETHISVVVSVGDRVYKLKKPIELPFLDWRSGAARREMCAREVELNRRTSPDVYLGVAAVGDVRGAVCDHLVVMRRMPDERRLSRLARDGTVPPGAIDGLAALVATFHARAERSDAIAHAAGVDAVARNWADNLTTLQQHAPGVLDPVAVGAVDRMAHAYLAGRRPLFDARARAGRAVDGHGDLLADDIYLLDDGPRVLDCLEFSDRLRAVDVLDDVAFLVMDLEDLGVAALGREFLEAYVRHSGERHPSSLLHHYVAYRAGVRAKVACLRSDQGDTAAIVRARRLLELARSHLARGAPRLVLVGGHPGTGKSTIADAIGGRTGWPVIRSDVVRKELAGVEPQTSMAAGFREGIYTPASTQVTYRELLDRARHRLEQGESVVLDASFSDGTWRERAAAVATSTSSDIVMLRCEAPAELAERRLRHRRPGGASDATPAIARAMAAIADPWEGGVHVIDTSGPVEEASAAAAARIGPFDEATAAPASPGRAG